MSCMHNYKMTVAYDGTNYGGWQIQGNAPTIQSNLQTVIKVLLKDDVHVTGSGRTDSGVHALGQIAHFMHPTEIDLARFINSLNALLPRDIRIIQIKEVPLAFHARYSAIAKTYHYNICLDKFQNPFKRLYSLYVHEKVDLVLLKEAADFFVGTHDFTSFANEAHSGCAARDAIRTIEYLKVISQEGGVRLEFKANGFLYKMVRNIVGTLLEIASSKRSIETLPDIFMSKDRKKAGKAAAPHGLFLMNVDYPEILESLSE